MSQVSVRLEGEPFSAVTLAAFERDQHLCYSLSGEILSPPVGLASRPIQALLVVCVPLLQ